MVFSRSHHQRRILDGMIRSTFAAVPNAARALGEGRRVRPRHARARASIDADRFFAAQAILKGTSLNGHDIALSSRPPALPVP